MIKVYKEISLQAFEAWGGALSTMEMIEDLDAWDSLGGYITEIYPDGIEDITLNDLLWFDGEDILRDLGYPVDEG